MEATQHDYGLRIFWQICQDESTASGASSQEMQQLALQSLQDMFAENFRKDIRLQYLLKSVLNILQLKSVVQSTIIATSVISIINID